MSYTLVIVESPNKTKKIEGFLGAGHRCVATFGHFRDLPESGGLGIVFQDGKVVPQYEIMDKGKRAIATIKQLIKDASKVVLATDPDREGEAISWHLEQALRIPRNVPCVRATFHAMTKDEVVRALRESRSVDVNLVNAQQSRRMLDRCVGWIVSATMRNTVRDAKSAGRVQSVAVRMVVEREREIAEFKPLTYFAIDATLERNSQKPKFVARMLAYEGKVIGQTWTGKDVAEHALARCRKAVWQVALVDRNVVDKAPPAPFTTSTVQQAASVSLKMAPKACMDCLQRLFEAGHITYHRTDSPTLSPEAITGAREWIATNLRKEYLPEKPRTYHAKGNAQEAHEAIRPTHWETGPDAVAGDDGLLYKLIWTRFIASQCADGRDSRTTVTINAFEQAHNDPFALFQARGVFPSFDGWRRITHLAEDERLDAEEKLDMLDEDILLPPLATDDWLVMLDLAMKKCATKPPPRYTEAKLIAAMEKQGIGRPSTYASIMTTIVDRKYVQKKKLKLYATDIGQQSNDYLVKHFAGDFIDIGFTRQVELDLDLIAAGKLDWQAFTTRCANGLSERAKAAGCSGNPLAPKAAHTPAIATGIVCPACGKGMIKRPGANGDFYGCATFPKCRGTRPVVEPQAAPSAPPSPGVSKPDLAPPVSAQICPQCGKSMMLRTSARGSFLGCSGYPKCRGTRNVAPD